MEIAPIDSTEALAKATVNKFIEKDNLYMAAEVKRK